MGERIGFRDCESNQDMEMFPALKLIREATDRFPATRILWPALAVIALISIIETLRLGPTALIGGAVFVFLSLVVFFVILALASFLQKARLPLEMPVMVLIYFFIFLICAFCGLSLTCFFFHKPFSFAQLLALQDDEVINRHEKLHQPEPDYEKLNAPSPPNTNNASKPQLNDCLNGIQKEALSIVAFEAKAKDCLRQRGG